MGRRTVPQREVPALLAELKELGATEVRRYPSRVDGSVVVGWKDSPLERQRREADLQAWRLPFAMAAVIVVIIVATVVLMAL